MKKFLALAAIALVGTTSAFAQEGDETNLNLTANVIVPMAVTLDRSYIDFGTIDKTVDATVSGLTNGIHISGQAGDSYMISLAGANKTGSNTVGVPLHTAATGAVGGSPVLPVTLSMNIGTVDGFDEPLTMPGIGIQNAYFYSAADATNSTRGSYNGDITIVVAYN